MGFASHLTPISPGTSLRTTNARRWIGQWLRPLWKRPIFKVQTDGIGLFPAPRPVLFIKVLRNPIVEALHKQLWERMASINTDLNPYYNAENWQPHISMVYGDLTS